jgi:hypothetical protein
MSVATKSSLQVYQTADPRHKSMMFQGSHQKWQRAASMRTKISCEGGPLVIPTWKTYELHRISCLPAEIHQDGLFHMTQKYPKIPIFESFSLSMSFLSYHMIIVCLTNIPGCFPQLERLKDSINSHNKRWVVLVFGTVFFCVPFLLRKCSWCFHNYCREDLGRVWNSNTH